MFKIIIRMKIVMKITKISGYKWTNYNFERTT